MKKHLLWTLLAIGINVSAFGVYYLHGTNSSQINSQSPENEIRPELESLDEEEAKGHEEAKLWREMAWKDKSGKIPSNAISKALKERDDYWKNKSKTKSLRKHLPT